MESLLCVDFFFSGMRTIDICSLAAKFKFDNVGDMQRIH